MHTKRVAQLFRRLLLIVVACGLVGCGLLLVVGDRQRTEDISGVDGLYERRTAAAADAGRSSSALFAVKPLVIWSSNVHPTPVVDLAAFLRPLGVDVLVKDLSNNYCQHFNVCTTRNGLRVIDVHNIHRHQGYRDLIPRFYDAYKDDAEMRTVDAYLCFHPPNACLVFEPFQRAVVIVATTRYNVGQSSPTRHWNNWNRKLTELAAWTWNVVGANNRYDVEYMRYFTGIEPQLLPSTCDHVADVAYAPSRPGYLLWPRPRDTRLFEEHFLREMADAAGGSSAQNSTVRLNRLRDLYPTYELTDLAAHRGIVHIPYQVSIMSVLEQYRIGIPLIVPSKDLLVRWHLERFVVHEKTESPPRRARFVQRPLRRSNIPAHPTQRHLPDPNDDTSADALGYWFQFADFYALPHIIYFNSTAHLVRLLDALTDDGLMEVSRRMVGYSRVVRNETLEKWKKNLLEIAKRSPNKPH